jgi:hypothetical protein
MKPTNIKADEDFQTWDLYKDSYRHLFNKLEVALQQGLHAGPAGVPPQKDGIYIYRPTYNLYGMGIGAKKFVYDSSMADEIISNGVVPPGSFWCEWVDGIQRSIDFHRNPETGKFYVRSVWQGVHYDDTNLTKFKHWIRVPYEIAPYDIRLKLPWEDPDVTAINLEMRGDYVIEAHLRLGGDPFDDLPIGTKVTPVWDDMVVPDQAEFLPNPDEEGTGDFSASGNLTNIRKGYIVERPKQ